MKKIHNFLLLVFVCFVSISSSYAAVLELEAGSFQKDDKLGMILVYHPNYDFDKGTYTSLLLDGEEYSLESPMDNFDTQTAYSCTNGDQEFKLYFTSYPIISIDIDAEINNEEKQLATFSYCDKKQMLISNVGIKFRGMTSLSFLKKSYTVEFWDDEIGEVSKDVEFGKLRNDDDWVLDGVFNEPLRMRAYLSHKLWLEMNKEKKSKSGADVMFIELFLNKQYIGIYLLSENIDRKLLNLKKTTDVMRGEIYKGRGCSPTTLFKGVVPFVQGQPYWKGWDCQYPKDESLIDWQNMYDFVSFVAYSSQEDFNEEVWKLTDKRRFKDYYLFINLLMATDNYAKNVIIARKDSDKPYFFVPWDLDGTFGNDPCWGYYHKYDSLIASEFMNKALLDPIYKKEVNEDWAKYRKDLFSYDKLIQNMEVVYNDFTNNLLYEREHMAYTMHTFGKDHPDYFKTWLNNRLGFLDMYFDYYQAYEDLEQDVMTIYPNPALNFCKIICTEAVNTSYCIYNTYGELIESAPFNGKVSLNLSKCTPGVYVVKIDNHVGKFIISK